MRIAQIVFPTATEYERKSQRIDFNSLSARHEVIVLSSTRDLRKVDVAHIYSGSPLPPAELVGFSTPYDASMAAPRLRGALVIRDAAAYGLILTQGHGMFGTHRVSTPSMCKNTFSGLMSR